MPPCVRALCSTRVATAAMAALLLLGTGAARAAPTLAERLEQHALMLAAAARSSNPDDAPEQAARYIETVLASQGHTVSRHDYPRQGQPMHQIDVTVANPATALPAERVLVVGAAYASSTRRNDNETAAIIELARLLKRLRPAQGTELKFVFFVNGMSPETGNFIAFAGPRTAAELVRKTLATFHATLPAEGLAAPAYVEGVTVLGHGGTTLMITEIAFLHYPYSHTLQGALDAHDYAIMARSVASLARVVAAMAAPPSM
jgi:hypothetical protein